MLKGILGTALAACGLDAFAPSPPRESRRAAALAEIADRTGWQTGAGADTVTSILAFPPFDREGIHTFRNVAHGIFGGRRMWAFEHDHPSGVGSFATASVLAVALEAPLPPTLVEHDGGGHLGAKRRRDLPPVPVLPVEPTWAPYDGTQHYRVVSADPAFAGRIQAPVLAVLTRWPGLTWGVDGPVMYLIRSGPHWLERQEDALHLADAFECQLRTALAEGR